MNKQLQLLLDDSLVHYRGRHLKKALNAAQIALEFGLNAPGEYQGLVRANIILAKIFTANGRFQCEPSFFQKALQNIEEAKRFRAACNCPLANIEILLVYGTIQLNLKAYDEAEAALRESLALARLYDDAAGIVESLSELSHLQLLTAQPDKAVTTALEGLEFLRNNVRTNHASLWSGIYLQLSQAYITQQEYSLSLEMSQSLLQASRSAGDIEKEVVALRNIAVVCGVKSNYKIGMQYFLEALDKCEAIGYRELTAQIQINIGTLYAHLYNYDEAVKRYETVLENFEEVLDQKTKSVVFNNLGNIYFTSDNLPTALTYFQKTYDTASSCGFEDMAAYALAQLGRTKLGLNLPQEAALDAHRAAGIFDRIGAVNGKQINLLNLARLAFEAGDLPAATAEAHEAIRLAKQIKDDTSEIKAYKLLAMIYKAKGNFEKALEYQELFSEIQEEFAKVQRNRQFLDLEIRNAIREKQKEIEQLTKEKDYQSLLLQKSDQISRQNEELLSANEDLRHFTYIASHDLKEPLRMIGSFTQVIRKIAEPHIPERDAEYFKYISDGVHRMNSLLDGLLKYSTINKSQVEIAPVRMNDVVAMSLDNLRIRMMETGAEVVVSDLPLLQSSQQLLVQVFQNLINNALKFVKPGVKPLVKITHQELEAEHVVAVTDNGIGISPANQSKIFEIFQRLHHASEYEGTGIGLAICQKIVKRLGGHITVSSELGQGATFAVYLPKYTDAPKR